MGEHFPRRVGRYDIRGELGRGGQGIVFLAHDPRLDREVAIKVLGRSMSQDRDAFARFQREARATAKLHHPNIVEIFDHSAEADERAYIVSERLSGKPLGQVLSMREKPLDVPVAVALAHELCLALQHAHDRNVIHRDLKPDNVFWEPNGRVVLVDFGIAKEINSARDASTQLMGTPYYFAPEQISQGRATKASDLFSLGTLLFFMLTKQEAFESPSVLGIMKRIMDGDARNIEELRSGLPAPLLRLLKQLLATAPGERPRSAEQVADRLLEIVPGDPRRILRDALATLQVETGAWTHSEGKRIDTGTCITATEVKTVARIKLQRRRPAWVAGIAVAGALAIGWDADPPAKPRTAVATAERPMGLPMFELPTPADVPPVEPVLKARR